MKNKSLIQAKKKKDDEFYTLFDDIKEELQHYKPHFQGATVYLNCDNPYKSNFFKYFINYFNELKLKKLIATCYNPNGKGIGSIYEGQKFNHEKEILTFQLNSNGDFRSQECLTLLKNSDIVVTNPPLSLLREFVKTMMTYDKQFLIIANMNTVATKDLFNFFKEGKIWLGVRKHGKMLFEVPNKFAKKTEGDKLVEIPFACWLTNLKIDKPSEEIVCSCQYKGNENLYPKYDNYDAIEVSSVRKIPYDYDGKMGVPVNFIFHFNPKQFEIVSLLSTPVLRGKEIYKRIIIQRKEKSNNSITFSQP